MTGFFDVEYVSCIQGALVSLVIPSNFVDVPIGPNSAVLMFANYYTDSNNSYYVIHRASKRFSKNKFCCVSDKLVQRYHGHSYQSSFDNALNEMNHRSQRVVRVDVDVVGIYDMNNIYDVTEDVLHELEARVLEPNTYFMRSKFSKIGI